MEPGPVQSTLFLGQPVIYVSPGVHVCEKPCSLKAFWLIRFPQGFFILHSRDIWRAHHKEEMKDGKEG